MKKKLLDVEAILSCATAELSRPNPNIEEVKHKVDLTREKLLELVEGLEGPDLN